MTSGDESKPAPTDGPSLYDRIGGEAVLGEVIDNFYDAVLEDEELAAFFANSEMGSLRRMLVEFVSAALDGPIAYSGKPLAYAHQGRGIQIHHFQKFVNLMLAQFKLLELDAHDEYEILSRIALYADHITGGFGVDG